jgi:ketosteroid isomerase-like protein
VSSENVGLANRIMSSLPLHDLAGAFSDSGKVAAMATTLEPLVEPDVEVVRIGPEYTGEGITYRGLAGFLEFWTDWLEPWQSFRIETEGFRDAGDKVVQLARQTGLMEAGGAPIESHGAAVMTFRGGKVTRIELHLDRDRALRSAGLAE